MFNGSRIDALEKRIDELEKQLAYSTKPVLTRCWLGTFYEQKPDIGVAQALRLLTAHLGLTIERQEGPVVKVIKKPARKR